MELSEKTLIRDLTQGNPMKQLLSFSFPFILANLLQQAYNMADMVIVGQFVGSAGLAAASAGGELATLFLFFAFGFTSSGQIIISQHIGAGERDKVGSTIGTLMSFIFLCGVVFTVFALFACDWMISLINVPQEAVRYAHDYCFVYYIGMIPVFGYNVVSAILRGIGDSRHPFIFIAIAAVTNIVLDLLFVGPLGMACFGAALATVISQSLSFAIAMVFLYRHRADLGFDFGWKRFRMDKKELQAMVRLGLPLSIQSVAVSISMLVIARFINAYGVVASAATAVGNKLTLVATICTTAMMTAGNSVIAQNFAARKLDRVAKTIGSMLIINMGFCALLALIFALFPEQVFSLFDQDPEVLAMSHPYVPICALNMLGFATRATAMAFINGIGNSRLSFIAGFIDGIVARIGLSLLFGIFLGMGVQGFWLGSSLAGLVIGVIGAFYYASGKWKTRKLLV